MSEIEIAITIGIVCLSIGYGIGRWNIIRQIKKD